MSEDTELGVLPDFLVIGAQRSGTTALYDLLCRHSRIVPAARKEVHYFDKRYAPGSDLYGSYFTPEPGKITGEATPFYIFHRSVPYRIKSLIPNVRLVAILRDPADRALSHYHLNRRRGHEPLDTFEAAIAAEEDRLADARARCPLSHQNPYDDPDYSRFSYKARGRYADQLERWLIHFDPSQLLVLKSEDFYGEPDGVLRRVQSHLGLPEETLSDDSGGSHRPELLSGHMGEYEPMKPDTRRRLGEHFAPHNEHLRNVFGVAFD